MLLVVNLQIYPEAWMVVALGIGCRLVPWLAGRPGHWWRWLVWSFPGLVASVLILAGSVYLGDWLKERREDRSRPRHRPASPNVLFIVLDTVRADRLSLYGYHRATTPTLERLAKRGIRFDAARATAPWTLASHAGFFTGRWPHELNVEWETPLTTNFPMLAEYLGAHGYATAGIVANARYCSYDTGLTAASRTMRITSSRNSVFCARPRSSSGPGRRSSSGLSWVFVTTRVYFIPRRIPGDLVGLRISTGCGIDQSRVPELARPPRSNRASVLRVPQLPRRPRALQASRPMRPPASVAGLRHR